MSSGDDSIAADLTYGHDGWLHWCAATVLCDELQLLPTLLQKLMKIKAAC